MIRLNKQRTCIYDTGQYQPLLSMTWALDKENRLTVWDAASNPIAHRVSREDEPDLWEFFLEHIYDKEMHNVL